MSKPKQNNGEEAAPMVHFRMPFRLRQRMRTEAVRQNESQTQFIIRSIELRLDAMRANGGK